MTAGVYFNKQYKKYHARIYLGQVNGRSTYFHVGRYESKDLAQERADQALRELEENEF